MKGDPIEGQIMQLIAAKASVGPSRIPSLIDDAQSHLTEQLGQYRREYERVLADTEYDIFFVESGHWEEVGDQLAFSDAETDAVFRAHRAQLLRIGRRKDRLEEFEMALEIREPLIIGTEKGG